MGRPTLHEAKLRPADVLLSFGDSAISRGIVELDGGAYSHVAVWSGDSVIESTLPVVRAAPLADCAAHALLIDVFRRRDGVEPESILRAARGYLGRPYGAVDLGLSTLVLAVCSWMPTDWSEMAALYGLGTLDRMLRVLLQQSRDEERLTCAGLIARTYQDSGVPLTVHLCFGRTLHGPSFVRALQALSARLLEGHAAVGTTPRGGDLFEPRLPQADVWGDELRFVLSVPPLGSAHDGEPRARAEDLERLRRGFIAGLLPSAPGSESRARLIDGIDTRPEVLAKLPLRAGIDWPVGLVTPRQLESSPDLERVGRAWSRAS